MKTVLELEEEEQRLMAEMGARDAYFWMTQCTKTKDEQDAENPYKPFPDKLYLRLLLAYLEHYPSRVKLIKKSRTMMASWTVSGWAAHRCFTKPATCAVFQSQDERRAVADVEYSKELHKNSIPALRDRWLLDKAIDKQAQHEFQLSNGSQMIAIPRDPDSIRSAHPTIVVLDEAAFMPDAEASYNVALASNCLHLIALSSAYPGWFAEITGSAVPAPFPDFESLHQ